ncbi:SLC13 family permease [Nocardioides sp. L-11A]|uniref:SLC13 family permease n=1 Tax=Nocardioides sp. L-11A TaxID=3043848 RepID=UPI00249A99F5|nr:SLC13 family permease [Nocardioides sp. L-11A]
MVTTLASVFCLLAVVRALDGVHFFGAVAERIVELLRTRRSLVLGLVLLTLLASMLITNDMALLTLLPLTAVTLRATGNDDLLAYVFVLEAVAANLGGMITPFGSPQNLYLYQHYALGIGDFLRIMALPFAASVVLIVLACLPIRRTPHEPVAFPHRTAVGRSLLYLALFAVTVAIVLRVLPWWAGLGVVAVLLVADRSALLKVDYLLIGVLALFFMVAEALARVPSIAAALGDLLAHDPLLVSALASQVLSNVPTAVLAAPFTAEHAQLLVGVNVGGVGTVVASLASLIALRHYAALRPGGTGAFLRVFTLVNVVFLVALLVTTRGAVAAGWL